jgi:hypothetical protein
MIPFAQKVLSELPTVPAGTNRSNNYQQLLLSPRDYTDKYDAKLDGQINDRMNAFLRFSQRKMNQFNSPYLEGPSGGSNAGYVRSLSQAAALGYTWTVTPTSLIELRMSFTHMLAGKQPPFLGGASMLSIYGIPGLPTSPDLTGGLNTQNITGFTTGIMGRQATNPQFQNPTTWNPKLNYSLIKGRHSLRMGAELHIIHTQVMDINPVYGLDGYAGSFSKPTCAQLGQPATCTVANDAATYNLADFMFGLPSQIQLANYLIGNYRQRDYYFYFQDDFHVSNKLSLNLGLRWEFATPRWERDNALSNFSPSTNSMILAKNGGLYDRTLVDPDYRDWAPRIGLAYSINPKTVFRGGYGISYTHLNRLGSADELGINGPQVVIGTINQSIPGKPRQPGQLQPNQRQPLLYPARHPVALRAELVCLPAARTGEALGVGDWIFRQPWRPVADPGRLQSGAAQPAGRVARHPAAAAQPELRRHHLGESVGPDHLQRLLFALGAPLRFGTVLPQLLHLVQGHGQLRAGPGESRGIHARQSTRHL